MAVDPKTEQKIMERAERILRDFDADPRRIAVLAAQFQTFADGKKPKGDLFVSGGVSSRDGSPFVRFEFEGDIAIQLSPQEAREHALMILEAAEASVTDAATFRFALEGLKVERERAAQVVALVREFRADRWGGGGGGDGSADGDSS